MTPETETLIARLEAKHESQWEAFGGPLLELTNPDGPQAATTIREQAAEIEMLMAYAAKLEEGIKAADLLCDATNKLVASVEAHKALGEQP